MRRIGGSATPAVIAAAVIVLAIAILGRVGAAAAPAAAAPAQSAAAVGRTTRVDYERDIKPILADNCLECHSQDKRKGGLSLSSYGDVLDGGKDGPIVRPGNAARSMMIAKVKGEQGDRMPLDE